MFSRRFPAVKRKRLAAMQDGAQILPAGALEDLSGTAGRRINRAMSKPPRDADSCAHELCADAAIAMRGRDIERTEPRAVLRQIRHRALAQNDNPAWRPIVIGDQAYWQTLRVQALVKVLLHVGAGALAVILGPFGDEPRGEAGDRLRALGKEGDLHG